MEGRLLCELISDWNPALNALQSRLAGQMLGKIAYNQGSLGVTKQLVLNLSLNFGIPEN